MSEENTLQEAAEDSYVLDSEEVEQTEAPEPEQEQPEGEPEAAADTGDNQEEKIKFDEKQQAWINSTLARQKREQRELERRAEEAEKRAQELASKLPQDKRPEIPPIPDRYDDDYEAKIKAREEAITKAAEWDARERARSEEQYRLQQQQAEQQRQAFTQTVHSYSERAEKLGLSKEELQRAGQTVAAYNLPDMVAMYILEEAQGPMITKYLAQNVMELETLRALPPHMAVARLASEIKPKAAGSKPKQKLAPDPHEPLSGMGAREKQPGPPGATFE